MHFTKVFVKSKFVKPKRMILYIKVCNRLVLYYRFENATNVLWRVDRSSFGNSSLKQFFF